MATPASLPGLTPREAAADAIHRCVLGIDNNDQALFETACVKDDSIAFVAGPATVQGWESFNGLMQKAFGLVTTHVISNVRVNLESEAAETASLTAHAVAYHNRPEDALKQEDTSYTAGCLYFIDVVKDGGLWKIKRWEVKILWTTGDRTVVHP